MKILVDENIPSCHKIARHNIAMKGQAMTWQAITVDELRELNHDVKDIRGTEFEGIDDPYLFELALKENRLLIRTDRGFSKVQNKIHSGILIITLKKPNEKSIHEKIVNVIKKYSDIYFQSKIIIVKDYVFSVRGIYRDD